MPICVSRFMFHGYLNSNALLLYIIAHVGFDAYQYHQVPLFIFEDCDWEVVNLVDNSNSGIPLFDPNRTALAKVFRVSGAGDW